MSGGDESLEQADGPTRSTAGQIPDVGDQLGRYKILRKIGSGGMGEVFAAEDPDLNREVALKLLPQSMAANPEIVQRFEREAQSIAQLEHSNIVTIYSVEQADGVQFITMQLVDGETLRTQIKEGGAPLYEFFDLAIQMADAVGSAHEHGIIHRDLKPENILVTRDGRVMILDFGLAKLLDEVEPRGLKDEVSHLTSDGIVMGTMDYMSPEQAEGKVVDHRTDIFSLGIVLQELVAGSHPFKGDSALSVISSIVKDPAPSILEAKPELPRSLDRILHLALEKNREHRTQSMKDLRNQLEGLKRETAAVPRATAPRRISPLAIAGLSFVVGAGMMFALTGSLSSDPARGSDVQFGAIRRIAGDPELEVYPAISPSGKMIAYARGSAGHRKLYLKHVAGGKPVALTEQYEGSHRWPQWSPDESQISFEADGKRWLIAPFPSDRRPMEGADGVGGITWSPSGDRVVYVRGSELILRDFSGGDETTLVDTFEPTAPSWSPDGEFIAFVSGNPSYLFATFLLGNIAPSSISLIPAAGGEAVTLVEEDALNICPQWLGPRRLLYISDRHGPNDLYLLELDDSGKPTGPPVRLTTGLGAQSYTMSADKSVIAFSSFDKESNIWKLPIPTGDQPVINTGATPVTFGSQVIEGVGIARDGSALVFDSNRGGNQDIYKLQLPDGEQQQLTVDPASEFIPDFSPDGSEITFHSFATGNRDLFTMSSDGTEVTQVTTSTSEERFPKWSPDGNSLSFYSDRTGRPEVMITTRSARGEPWSDAVQVSHDGGGPSAWSPDGEWLAYGNSQGLMLVSVSGGEPSPIGTSGVEFKRDPYIQWSRDGQILYVKSWGSDGVAAIWEVSRESGEMRQLVRFDDPSMPTGRPEFALDDEFFYFTVAKQQNDIFTLDISARSGD